VWGYRNVSSVISSASDYICHPKQLISALSPYFSPMLHPCTWIAKVGAALEFVFTAKSSGESLVEGDSYSIHALLSAPAVLTTLPRRTLAGRRLKGHPQHKVGAEKHAGGAQGKC